jgi:hypothetical protein
MKVRTLFFESRGKKRHNDTGDPLTVKWGDERVHLQEAGSI